MVDSRLLIGLLAALGGWFVALRTLSRLRIAWSGQIVLAGSIWDHAGRSIVRSEPARDVSPAAEGGPARDNRLQDLVSEITQSGAEPRILQERLVQAVLELTGGEVGSLWLLTPDGGAFKAQADINLSGSNMTPVTGIRISLSADIAIRRLRRQRDLLNLRDLSETEREESFFSGIGPSDLALLPLAQQNELTGFLLLGRLSGGSLDERSLRELQEDTPIISLIAENWRLKDAEREEGRRMQTLAELSATLTARRRLRDVLPEIVATGRKLARSLTCTLLLIDEERNRIELAAGAGLGGDEVPEVSIPLDNPIMASFIDEASTLVVTDVDGEMPNLRSLMVRREAESIQIYPLMISNVVIGALTVGHDDRRRPSDTEQNLVETLASVAASAIQNARAFEAELEHVKLITTVSAISRRVSGILDTEWMLQEVCSLLGLELEYPYVHAFLVDQNANTLRYIAGSSPSGPVIMEGFELSTRDDSLVGVTARTGQPQMGVPTDSDRFHRELALDNVQSELIVPISAHNRVVGILAIQSTVEGQFDEEDLQLLNLVADQLSIALDNARHHAQVREQARLDSLTQVLNHGTFINSLHELVRIAKKTGVPLSVIMLDVDRFKEYNDEFGHVAGDAALRSTVQAIEANIKSRDLVGRWGGEEFGIVLLGATKDQAGMVAERIRATLASLVPVDRLGRKMPPPSVSQGIATLEIDALDPDRLVDLADQALYAAKEHGRDQVRKAGEPSEG